MASNPGNFTVRGVHVNQALTNLSLGYHPANMVAEQVFGVLPVVHESDYYYKWDKGQALRVERTDGLGSLRADRTRAKHVNFGATLDMYTNEEYALETSISDRERANQDSVLNLEVSKIRRVQDLVLLDQEIRVATTLTTTGNYGSSNRITLSGTDQWNNASFASQAGSQSVIEQRVDDGREAIRTATGGKEANTIIIPRIVARVMKRDIGVRDQIKYTDPSILVGGELPPTLWGLKVIMPGGVLNTAVEGEAYSSSDVWGKNVIVAYCAAPGIDDLTLGAIFRSRPWEVKQWREEEVDTTFYRAGFVQSEKLISADCGYLIHNAIA